MAAGRPAGGARARSAARRRQRGRAAHGLKGLTSFRVLVEQLGPKVEKEGVLSREVLQADVESRLAAAEIYS